MNLLVPNKVLHHVFVRVVRVLAYCCLSHARTSNDVRFHDTSIIHSNSILLHFCVLLIFTGNIRYSNVVLLCANWYDCCGFKWLYMIPVQHLHELCLSVIRIYRIWFNVIGKFVCESRSFCLFITSLWQIR